MSKWGKEKKNEEFYNQFEEDYRRFHVKSDDLDTSFTENDEDWYDSIFPNKIVRNKAKLFHLGDDWRHLEDVIRDNDAYGIGKAKRGGKKSMSALAAIADSNASDMVAVCDKIVGFPYKGRIGDDKPYGEKCDLYLNGFHLGNVDKIEGTSINASKDPIAIGNIRESETVKVKHEVIDGKFKKIPIKYDFYKGNLTLHIPDKSDTSYGKREFKLKGDVTMDLPVITRSLDGIGDEELDDNNLLDKDKYRYTYPCQILSENNQVQGYKCVNWVKFMTRDKASDLFDINKSNEKLVV